MREELFAFFKEKGAVIDEEKGRAELVQSDSGSKSRVIAYFLSESMYVIVWDIKSNVPPDISFGLCNMSGEGRFLSVTYCGRGKCEFNNKEGMSVYLSAGEVAMDFYRDESGTSDFHTDDFLGVEVVMQVDKVITELPTLAMLKTAIKRMDMPGYATSINSLYFVDAQHDTRRTADELIRYCADSSDKELIVLKAAELGHSIGRDLADLNMKERTFVSPYQAKIAEDVHDMLTKEYRNKLPIKVFAEKYGISESSIKNYFRNIYGCGVQEYHRRVRMEKAAELLVNTNLGIGETAYRVGYASISKFRETFTLFYGATPLEYRRKAKGQM